MATQVQSPTNTTNHRIVDLCDDDDDDVLSAANSEEDVHVVTKRGRFLRKAPRRHYHSPVQMQRNDGTYTYMNGIVTLVDDGDSASKRWKRKVNEEVGDDEVQIVADHQQSPGHSIRNATPNQRTKDPPVGVVGVARMPTPVATTAAAKRRRRLEFDDDDDDDEVAIIKSPKGNLKQGDDNEEEVQVVKETQATSRRRRQRHLHQQQQPVEVVAPPEPPQPSWMRVLEVFPDAQVEHVQALLKEHNDHVTGILCLLAEKGYPKADNQPLFQKELPTTTVTIATTAPPTRTVSLDFLSPNSFTPNVVYKKEVVSCIVAAFPFLTQAGARVHLQNAGFHYAICHEQIRKALVCGSGDTKKKGVVDKDEEEAEEERQYKSFKYILTGQQDLSVDERARLFAVAQRSTVASNPMSSCRRHAGVSLTITHPTLKEEVEFVKQQTRAWMETMDARVARRQIREDCKKNGTAVSCGCCFDEFALEEMVACREEGHLFCADCVASYAENQIFGAGSFGINRNTKKQAMELLCMHGDGCTSGFQTAQLRKALAEKVLVKYDELQFQKAMDCANMDDMCACPKCGFQAALPTTEMIFRCPVSDCRFESCRKCGEPSHIPLRCEEVEKQVETNGRVTVEEAISKAKIRTCPNPKCSQSFIKSDGCNKMTCPCGLRICYICCKQINGYDHFCQLPHCTHEACNKCKLYSNAEEDDKRAMREAGLLAAELVRKECQKQQQQEQQNQPPGLKKAPAAPVDVQVDVEKLLSGPPAATK